MSSASYAHTRDEDKKLISQALEISEPTTETLSTTRTSDEPEIESVVEIEPEKTDDKPATAVVAKKKTKVDSSYYSVNKFNFLFYLMYKMKYTEEGNKSKDKSKKAQTE